jgi:hypothetical protein
MAQRLQLIDTGNHVIAVYPDSKTKLDEAFAFLKSGLERNEVVVLVTEGMSKDEIRDRMRKEWKIENISELEENGDIIIKTNRELYYPDGVPNIERTIALWQTLVEQSLARGKRGIRAVGDTVPFFDNALSKELLDYEMALEDRFNFPLIGLCAYEQKDINTLTKEQFATLCGKHNPVWLDDDIKANLTFRS